MNIFYRILYALNHATMPRPAPWGWFHLMWLGLTFAAIFVLWLLRKRQGERQLKTVLLVYGITALVLEVTKQIIWSFNYADGAAVWDYQWYAAPFQLCTTPIFASLIAAFLKDCPRALFSYLAFFTILGSISTMLMPDSCFVETIEINIHTMWLHMGSFAVSVYLLMSGNVKLDFKSLLRGFYVFLGFAAVADIINIIVYKSGILHGETFNMFYISPYFVSSLPVFCDIQPKVPYAVYLFLYVFAIGMGGAIVFGICKCIEKIALKIKSKNTVAID